MFKFDDKMVCQTCPEGEKCQGNDDNCIGFSMDYSQKPPVFQKHDNKCKPWGNADQKIILVYNDDFTEVREHLNTGEWNIEFISACSGSGIETIRPIPPFVYAYVVLERN